MIFLILLHCLYLLNQSNGLIIFCPQFLFMLKILKPQDPLSTDHETLCNNDLSDDELKGLADDDEINDGHSIHISIACLQDHDSHHHCYRHQNVGQNYLVEPKSPGSQVIGELGLVSFVD